MTGKDDMPADPFNGLAAGAIATYEMYQAYINAGFTKLEAIQLITSILVAGMNRPNNPDKQTP